MEENKVTLNLKEYDKLKDIERDYLTLIDLLLQDTENRETGLEFSCYRSRLMRFIKVKFPEKYKERIKELKDEE